MQQIYNLHQIGFKVQVSRQKLCIMPKNFCKIISPSHTVAQEVKFAKISG